MAMSIHLFMKGLQVNQIILNKVLLLGLAKRPTPFYIISNELKIYSILLKISIYLHILDM
jgi:hypothetical protein